MIHTRSVAIVTQTIIIPQQTLHTFSGHSKETFKLHLER